MGEKKASDGRTRRGRRKRRKNYRHKHFDGSKKVVTGQSQNTKKTCFKSPTQNAKKDILGHVAIRCPFTQHFTQVDIIDVYTRVMTISRLNIFLILNGIFLAEKWSNTDLRSFLAPDFWNGMEWNGMESNPPFSNGIFLAEKWAITDHRSFLARTYSVQFSNITSQIIIL